MNLSDAASLARMALEDHELDSEWSITFDRSVRRFGVTRHNDRTISLSAPLVERNNDTAVVDVILHEVAHAIAGHAAGHGPQWKATARRIGANPSRCYDGDVNTPKAPWAVVCNLCGSKLGERHRRKLDVSNSTHRGCGGSVRWVPNV